MSPFLVLGVSGKCFDFYCILHRNSCKHTVLTLNTEMCIYHTKFGKSALTCLSIGTSKTTDFPFVSNGKSLILSVPIFKHIRVQVF